MYKCILQYVDFINETITVVSVTFEGYETSPKF